MTMSPPDSLKPLPPTPMASAPRARSPLAPRKPEVEPAGLPTPDLGPTEMADALDALALADAGPPSPSTSAVGLAPTTAPAMPERPPRPAPPAHLRAASHGKMRAVAPRVVLADVLAQALPLSFLLSWIAWTDFLTLTRTSRSIRKCLFDDEEVQEVVLCRFVPGFRDVWVNRDPSWIRDVDISLEDLQLLGMFIEL
jgi:hypothetical protein